MLPTTITLWNCTINHSSILYATNCLARQRIIKTIYHFSYTECNFSRVISQLSFSFYVACNQMCCKIFYARATRDLSGCRASTQLFCFSFPFFGSRIYIELHKYKLPVATCCFHSVYDVCFHKLSTLSRQKSTFSMAKQHVFWKIYLFETSKWTEIKLIRILWSGCLWTWHLLPKCKSHIRGL